MAATKTTPPVNVQFDDREIVQLDPAPAALTRADMRVPVQKVGVRGKTYQVPLAAVAGTTVTNDVRGGHKFVEFLYGAYFGVPAAASTLDRLDPETLVVGNTATVANPSATPTQQLLGAKQYRLAIAPPNVVNDLVNAYRSGAPGETRRRVCYWVEEGKQAANGASLEYFDPETVLAVEAGTTYKYLLGPDLRFFDARRNLTRAMFPQNRIPVPTGLRDDPNWIEASAAVYSHQQNTDAGTTGGSFTVGLNTVSQGDTQYRLIGFLADAQRAQVVLAARWVVNPVTGLDREELLQCFNYQHPPENPANRWTALGNITSLYIEDDMLVYDDARGATRVVGPMGGGGGGKFTITPTESDGGIVAGQTYTDVTSEDLWNLKLVRYQAPAFQGFTFRGANTQTVEEDTPFAAGVQEFAWAISNPANTKAGSLAIVDLTPDPDVSLATGLANDGVEGVATPAFTAVLGESRRFRMVGQNTQNNAFQAEAAVLFGALVLHYGASALNHAQMLAALGDLTKPLTEARAAELGFARELNNGRTKNHNYNCSGGRSVHVLVDARTGNTRPSVQQGPNTFSAFEWTDLQAKNRYGVTRNYYLLSTDTQTASSFNLNLLG